MMQLILFAWRFFLIALLVNLFLKRGKKVFGDGLDKEG